MRRQTTNVEDYISNLIQQSELSGLNEDQKALIGRLAKNAVDKKTGEIYTNIELDVSESFGMEKKQGEKVWDFIRRASEERKPNNELQTQNESLKATVQKLEEQIKEGQGNEGLKDQVSKLEKSIQEKDATILKMQSDQAAAIQGWEQKYNAKDKEIFNYQVNAAFSDFTSGLKFRSDIPEDVVNVVITEAKRSILNDYEVELMPTDHNGTKLVFKKDGVLQTHPSTLEALTGKDLIAARLKSVIDTGHQQSGAGTKGGAGNPKGKISGMVTAKTQAAVRAELESQAVGLGFAQGTKEYTEFIDTAWKDNNVSDMPIQ